MRNSLLYSHLYSWYEANHRDLPWRETNDPYRIWLSEIILQQTRVAQGLDYYFRFVNRWETVEALAAAKEEDVLREWQGLGYYTRARNLHKAAQMIVEHAWTPFPTRFEDIRSLPGVGEYTAGAIAAFAYNDAYLAMDGNVYRVLARLLDIDEPFDTTQGKKLFRQQAEKLLDREHPKLYNSAIMEFGALYCTPVLGDKCNDCPLQSICMAHIHGTAELLPVRKARPKVKDRWLDYHIYILEENNILYTFLHQRSNPHDIWFHLYEFPCEEHSTPPATKDAKAISFTHVLSHQRLHARFFVHRIDSDKDIESKLQDNIRIRWEDLEDFPFPRLLLRALEQLRVK